MAWLHHNLHQLLLCSLNRLILVAVALELTVLSKPEKGRWHRCLHLCVVVRALSHATPNLFAQPVCVHIHVSPIAKKASQR